MRTTLAIDDNILVAAKVAARRRGSTLGQLVEAALRRELFESAEKVPPPIPTFTGGTGAQPGVDLRSNRSLAELLDNPVHQGRSRRVE